MPSLRVDFGETPHLDILKHHSLLWNRFLIQADPERNQCTVGDISLGEGSALISGPTSNLLTVFRRQAKEAASVIRAEDCTDQ